MKQTSNRSGSNTCVNPISSDCVIVPVSLPGVGDCGNTSTLTNSLYSMATTINEDSEQLDISTLDLGCVYSPTVSTWTCPIGQTFVYDPTTSVGGAPGYCGIPGLGGIVAATNSVPVLVTSTNPTGPPTTLKELLQLIINKIPCCDPCKGVSG